MQLQNDFLSNRTFLKEKNTTLVELIQLAQRSYPPILLTTDESDSNEETSLEFIQKFNGSNEEEQRRFLANVTSMNELWTYLASNPTCYSCQMFLEELIHLASHVTSVKHHLGKPEYFRKSSLSDLSSSKLRRRSALHPGNFSWRQSSSRSFQTSSFAYQPSGTEEQTDDSVAQSILLRSSVWFSGVLWSHRTVDDSIANHFLEEERDRGIPFRWNYSSRNRREDQRDHPWTRWGRFLQDAPQSKRRLRT